MSKKYVRNTYRFDIGGAFGFYFKDCIGTIDGIDVQKGSSEDISSKHVLTRINFAKCQMYKGSSEEISSRHVLNHKGLTFAKCVVHRYCSWLEGTALDKSV